MRTLSDRWRRLSLAQQYILVSLAVLAGVALAGGWWITREIEAGVVHRTGETTALYVESFVSPSLQDVGERGELSPEQVAMLSRLLKDTPLGRQIVAFKIWSTDGRILFSNEPEAIGQQYPPTPSFQAATRGEVVSSVSSLQHEENLPERGRFSRLLETYSPVRAADSGQILAVVEFYQAVDELERALAATRQRVWLAVSGTTLGAYVLLAGMVKRGSDTIGRQQRALADSVDQLTALVAQNEALHERVRGAATRATALNERFLRRISAELHDGPAQDVSLALLRLRSVARGAMAVRAGASATDDRVEQDIATIEGCLQRAIHDLRGIASGLRLPELDGLTLTETVERVVQVHERRTGTSVALTIGSVSDDAPLPLKITVFRVIQEALANAYRHADGRGQQVRVTAVPGTLTVAISDDGPAAGGGAGHRPETGGRGATDGAPAMVGQQAAGGPYASAGQHPSERQPAGVEREHLGLAVMRERVESLGGRFVTTPRAAGGTVVRATLPLDGARRAGLQP